MIVRITRITCDKCGKQYETPYTMPLLLLMAYARDGWTLYKDSWYCPDCKPDNLQVDDTRHPHYYDYEDTWSKRSPENCRSHYFVDEPYDPYAALIQGQLCKICEYMNLGYEDDGSTWMMCCVDDPEDSYGHNLYSGHFYGAAIAGRICPYFTCEEIQGQDPKEDKKNGTFHVPYNECYDGD